MCTVKKIWMYIYIYNRTNSWAKQVELYIVYVQLIYLMNLIFKSSSAKLIHKLYLQLNYQIEFQTIHKLARIINGSSNHNKKEKQETCICGVLYVSIGSKATSTKTIMRWLLFLFERFSYLIKTKTTWAYDTSNRCRAFIKIK
jgi:hypothetical protein